MGAVAARTAGRILRSPFSLWTWAEFLYAVLRLPLGVFGFVLTVVSLVLGIVLSPTLLGLPLIVAGSLTARRLGALHRATARWLLRLNVEGPARFHADGPGLLGWLRSGLRDAAGWRARIFLLLQFPVAVACFVLAAGLRLAGLQFLLAPVFWRLWGDSPDGGLNGLVHQPVLEYDDFRFDTWPRTLLLSVLGVLLLLLAPWAVHGVLMVERVLIRRLLGPISLTERVRDLEQSRAAVVDDAAARLRRIERDLHDGAQARMVAVAMKLSLATQKLSPDTDRGDIDRARDLVMSAHATAMEAIVELRDLARGIHPPILDNGLAAALATLTARGAVPTTLSAEIPVRPSPSIETIAYFCAAELLTNVGKHSGARQASVDVDVAVTGTGLLRLRVTDDGRGGAAFRSGSGLAGLAERVRSVDGRVTLDSPAGGPTTVIVELPTRA